MPPARKQAGVPKQLDGACGGSEIAAHHPDGSNGTPGGHFVCFDLGKIGREAVIGAFHCEPVGGTKDEMAETRLLFRILMRADGLVDMIKTLLAVATAPISEGFRQ